MTTIEQQKKNNRLFLLVSANFTMLLVLFIGLGFALWQANSLFVQLKDDLQRAEQSIAELKQRVHTIDSEVLAQRLMTNIAGRVTTSVSDAIGGTELVGSLQNASQNLQQSREGLEETRDSLREIKRVIGQLDAEQLAQLVAYHLLKGLGEGFGQAAESRKPASAK